MEAHAGLVARPFGALTVPQDTYSMELGQGGADGVQPRATAGTPIGTPVSLARISRRRAIINASVGGEKTLTAKFSLQLGAFTDLSGTPNDATPPPDELHPRVNRFGLTLGFIRRSVHSTTHLAFVATHGWGTSVGLNDPAARPRFDTTAPRLNIIGGSTPTSPIPTTSTPREEAERAGALGDAVVLDARRPRGVGGRGRVRARGVARHGRAAERLRRAEGAVRATAALVGLALFALACTNTQPPTTITVRVDVPTGPPVTAAFLGVTLSPFGDGGASFLYDTSSHPTLDAGGHTFVVILRDNASQTLGRRRGCVLALRPLRGAPERRRRLRLPRLRRPYVAVGGLFPGPPTAATVFPATIAVDYVRVSVRAGDGGTNDAAPDDAAPDAAAPDVDASAE